MKLFRMAFWLGVVIYNLPSPASQSAAPESVEVRGLAAKAAGQFCPQPLVACAKTVEALPKRGEPGGHNSSRDAVKPSQDTLAPADRAVPWRGSQLDAHSGVTSSSRRSSWSCCTSLRRWRPSSLYMANPTNPHTGRSGFDRLVAALCAGQVGAVTLPRCLAARSQWPRLAPSPGVVRIGGCPCHRSRWRVLPVPTERPPAARHEGEHQRVRAGDHPVPI